MQQWRTGYDFPGTSDDAFRDTVIPVGHGPSVLFLTRASSGIYRYSPTIHFVCLMFGEMQVRKEPISRAASPYGLHLA